MSGRRSLEALRAAATEWRHDRKPHRHEYVDDPRPDWANSLVCRVCGFHLPGNLAEAAFAAGAIDAREPSQAGELPRSRRHTAADLRAAGEDDD